MPAGVLQMSTHIYPATGARAGPIATHGRRSLFAAQGLMHRYCDGDGAQGFGIEAGRVLGPGGLFHRRLSAVKSEKQGDEEGHHGKKQEHQSHPKHGELYPNIE
jgi:hypothetical protein